MPGLDRSGPQGQGSRTGRGMGKCNSPKTDDKTTDKKTDGPVEENNDFPYGAGNRRRFGQGQQGGQGFGRGPGGRGRFRGGRGRGMGRADS